jgi:hypothetical protein
MKHEQSDHLVSWDRTTIILTRESKELRLDNREPEVGYERGRSILSANVSREARRAEVVCWPAKPLKYLMVQNVKSPL